MYIWLAIDVDDQLSGLRAAAQRITDSLAAANPSLTLPLHISLRISFSVDDALFDRVIARVEEYYRTIQAFTVIPQQIEQNGGIVWLKMVPNDALARIHRELVTLLRDEFAVPAHPFDNDFRYHASLFINPDERKASAAYAELQHVPYPSVLTARKLVIGVSETGKAGEYRVWRAYEMAD